MFDSIAAALEQRAHDSSDQVAFVFLDDCGAESDSCTYGELYDRSLRVAALLICAGLKPGDRALLLHPPGLEFVSAFFGCLIAKVIAVPAFPPTGPEAAQRIIGILDDCGAATVLTVAQWVALIQAAGLSGSNRTSSDEVRVIATDCPRDEGTLDFGPPLCAEDPAFLQYTSGSTSAPKGVIVSHGNIIANQRMIQQAFRHDRSCISVGWLPLYHDMGLIGYIFQPIYIGFFTALMSPLTFLRNPRLWLAAISRYRATTSGGPNFAYELCLRRISAIDREGLDLSSWRVAFNAAEPIRSSTLDRFTEAFSTCGFRRRAFYPCYGLAEATLIVTGIEQGSGPQLVARPEAVEALNDRREPLVAVGRPLGDEIVAVVDPQSGALCEEHVIGEIWVSGSNVTPGYWKKAVQTSLSFNQTLAAYPGHRFLRTGDLGFWSAGELVISGRSNDLIIVRGQNYFPQDIEFTVERCSSQIRRGCVAAFGVDEHGDEALVVAADVRPLDSAGDYSELMALIREAIGNEFGLSLADIVLVPEHTVPKTSSGKVRRRECRRMYLSGELPRISAHILRSNEADRHSISSNLRERP